MIAVGREEPHESTVERGNQWRHRVVIVYLVASHSLERVAAFASGLLKSIGENIFKYK